MATELAKAYVQIVPSAEGIQGSISSVLDGEAISAGKSAGGLLGGALGTAAKVGVAAVAAVGTAVTATAGTFVASANNVADYGDSISKMAQKMSISAEAYQEWDFIAQHSGTSMESLKTSFKTLSLQAQKGAEEFETLGLSLDDVAKMSTEDLFSAVIEGLQGMEEGTERTAIASSLLGRGATELGALLNTSAEDTEEMRKQVHELGGVMSNEAVQAAASYKDSMQNMNTALDGIKNNLMAEFLPSMSTVMDGLASVFSGDDTGIESINDGLNEMLTQATVTVTKFSGIGSSILITLANGIIDNLPALVGTITFVLEELAGGLLDNSDMLTSCLVELVSILVDSVLTLAPTIIELGVKMIVELANGIASGLPTITPELVSVVLSIVDTLVNNAPLIIGAAVALIVGLGSGLISSLPIILEQLPVIIDGVINALIDSAPLIMQCGVELFTSLISNGPEIIEGIISLVPKILSSLVLAYRDGIPEMISAGKSMVDGFWKGISDNWGNLVSSVKNKGKELLSGMKETFGIHSPSKEFGDIADMCVTGYDDKFDNFGQKPVNAVKDTLDEITGLELEQKQTISYEDMQGSFSTTKFNKSEKDGTLDIIYQLLLMYLPEIATGKNIVLSPDKDNLFDLIVEKNEQYKKANSRSALA